MTMNDFYREAARWAFTGIPPTGVSPALYQMLEEQAIRFAEKAICEEMGGRRCPKY